MTSLLDVSVLLGLLDVNHEHHAVVMRWWDKHGEDPWASCPITQSGYLRIVSQDGYPNTISIDEAIEKLSQAVSDPRHKFLSDNISLLDQRRIAHKHIQGNKQLTDIHLLALSVSHGARFVTLDKRIAINTVRQATNASLQIITP